MNATAIHQNFNRPAAIPPVDIVEDPQGVTLLADLPGVSRDQLKLDIDGQRLAIDAERHGWADDRQPLLTEFAPRAFRRSFTLSKELDTSQISAELNAGVLKVRIPKAAHAQARRVSVQVN